MPTFAIAQLRQFFRHHSFIICDSPCNGQWVLFYFRTFKCNWNIFIYIGVYHILPCCNGWIHAFCAYRIIASNALCHKACRSVSRDNLGTFRNYDGEGDGDGDGDGDCNGNVEESIRFWAKQQLCTCITLFCTFLCLPCTTVTWNDQILSLLENGNGKAINSTISIWTRARLPLFSSNLNSLSLISRVTWVNREKVWKEAKSISQRSFHGRRRCRITKP